MPARKHQKSLGKGEKNKALTEELEGEDRKRKRKKTCDFRKKET